jgi:hypothetical protein
MDDTKEQATFFMCEEVYIHICTFIYIYTYIYINDFVFQTKNYTKCCLMNLYNILMDQQHIFFFCKGPNSILCFAGYSVFFVTTHLIYCSIKVVIDNM